MTYDNELKLISYTIEYDEIGQQKKIPIKTNILCAIKSVGRSEFYAAAQAGLKPEITFIIHAYEYNGEKEVEFEGEKYKVLRTYRKKYSIGEKKSNNILEAEEIELTCEKVIGNG